MKKLPTIFLVFFFLPMFSFSQDYWEQLYLPDTTNILSIAVNAQEEIFIGTGKNGATGGIYNSLDSGISWNFLGMGLFRFYSIAINNNGDIYAGANQSENNSGLYRSVDNGQSWEPILPDIGLYGNILAILPYGDTIFASIWTGGATILRSIDNGLTWQLVFSSSNSSEYVTDIIKSSSGEIFISLTAFQENMGGVYKSEDWGNTWQFIGLYNYMVTSLALNSSGDLFAGSYGGLGDTAMQGIYVLRAGDENWQGLTYPQVNDILINSEDDIFCSTAWPNGVVRSIDNGNTFELVNEGLAPGEMRELAIDNSGFIYVTNLSSINRTINTTVSIKENGLETGKIVLKLFPNPVINDFYINMIDHKLITEPLKISIYNCKGELVFKKEEAFSFENRILIDANNLKAGLYVIEITINNYEHHLNKFIKY